MTAPWVAQLHPKVPSACTANMWPSDPPTSTVPDGDTVMADARPRESGRWRLHWMLPEATPMLYR